MIKNPESFIARGVTYGSLLGGIGAAVYDAVNAHLKSLSGDEDGGKLSTAYLFTGDVPFLLAGVNYVMSADPDPKFANRSRVMSLVEGVTALAANVLVRSVNQELMLVGGILILVDLLGTTTHSATLVLRDFSRKTGLA